MKKVNLIQVAFRITVAQRKALKVRAKKLGTGESELIRHIISHALQVNER